MIRYNVTTIVNTELAEYEHIVQGETDLQALMQRILTVYPQATSVVMTVVIYKEPSL